MFFKVCYRHWEEWQWRDDHCWQCSHINTYNMRHADSVISRCSCKPEKSGLTKEWINKWASPDTFQGHPENSVCAINPDQLLLLEPYQDQTFPTMQVQCVCPCVSSYYLSGAFVTCSIFIGRTAKTLSAYLQIINKHWLDVCKFCLNSCECRLSEALDVCAWKTHFPPHSCLQWLFLSTSGEIW